MGDEEITLIRPVVEAAQNAAWMSPAPLRDTLFYYAYRGDYEVVVAMYHDQGLVALKMVAFESGVNWTLGCPSFAPRPITARLRHRRQGKADPSSMRAALRLAGRLAAKAPGVA